MSIFTLIFGLIAAGALFIFLGLSWSQKQREAPPQTPTGSVADPIWTIGDKASGFAGLMVVCIIVMFILFALVK